MKRKRLTPAQSRQLATVLIIAVLCIIVPLIRDQFQTSTTQPDAENPTHVPAANNSTNDTQHRPDDENLRPSFSYEDVPAFDGEFYITVNGNEPYFTDDQIQASSFEYYGPLDNLGRCTEATACIGSDLMPTAERGEINSVKPSGWKNRPYDFINGRYVYNRCHLIGYQLTAENANDKNLITGTRSLNILGMLPFENLTADYVNTTGMHVMYRVTPIFIGDELVCRGVLMEGLSVEDNGAGVKFCVFCYNVEPGVTIDYATGDNWAA